MYAFNLIDSTKGGLIHSYKVNLGTQGSSRYLQYKFLQLICSISNSSIISTAVKCFHGTVRRELPGQTSLTVRVLPSNMANPRRQGSSKYCQGPPLHSKISNSQCNTTIIGLLLHNKWSSTHRNTTIIISKIKCFRRRVQQELPAYLVRPLAFSMEDQGMQFNSRNYQSQLL